MCMAQDRSALQQVIITAQKIIGTYLLKSRAISEVRQRPFLIL